MDEIITGLSIIAAILAWVAKIYWSREHAAVMQQTINAKNEQIQTLKYQIDDLRNLTPMKIREYFDSVKKQLEEYVESLKDKLNLAEQELSNKDKQILDLKIKESENLDKITKIEDERDELKSKTTAIRFDLGKIEREIQIPTAVNFKIPNVDFKLINQITEQIASMRNIATHEDFEINYVDFADQFKKIGEQYAQIQEVVAKGFNLEAPVAGSLENRKGEKR